MNLITLGKKRAVRFRSLAATLFLILVQFSCNTYEMNSLWKTDDITIDGKSSDWVGKLSFIENAPISVGIQNDHEFVYICLITEHQFLSMQVMDQGMTLWFDPSGGKNKPFGIRFPLGRRFSRERRDSRPMPREEMDREQRMAEFRPAFKELEILYPEKDRSMKIPLDEAKGIEIALIPSSSVLVYELKVPLLERDEYPYTVGAKPGSTMGIGVEIPKMDMAAIRNAGRGGMGGGIPGGMRGGRMGRGQGNGLKIWAITHLASEKIVSPPYH